MSKIMTEASNLTPEQKMVLWHTGRRKENLKACSTPKLHAYFDICLEHQYLDEADQILAECERRGEPQFRTLSDMRTAVTEVLGRQADIGYTLSFFDHAFAHGNRYNDYLLVCNEMDQYARNLTHRLSVRDLADYIAFLYCCLLFAMAMGLQNAISRMKQTLTQCGIDANTIKSMLKNAIQDKAVQSALARTVDIWRNDGAQLLDESNAGQKIKPMKYKYRYAGPVFTFNDKIYRQ